MHLTNYDTQKQTVGQAINPVLQDKVQLLPLIFRKPAVIQRIPDFLHHGIVEIEIVKHAQTHTQHLFRLKKVADICPGITPAGRAAASLFYGAVIQLILGVEQIDLPAIGIQMAVPPVSGGIHACLKPDKMVGQGAVLTVRGLGKAKLAEVGGLTKKGRTGIMIERYI